MNTTSMLHQGWDVEVMKEAGDAASNAHIPSSPGFTAINQFPSQSNSLSQPSETSQAQQNQAKTRTTGKSSRRRNPTVALYLGLGGSAEPTHLMKYAPAPDRQPAPPQLARKRQATYNGDKAPTRKKAYTDSKDMSDQRRISVNLPVTNNVNQAITHKYDGSGGEPLATPTSTITPTATAPVIEQRRTKLKEAPPSIAVVTSTAPLLKTPNIYAAVSADEGDADFGQLCFDFEPNAYTTNSSSCPMQSPELIQHVEMQFDEDNFDDDLMDEDLLNLTTNIVDFSSSLNFRSSLPIQSKVVDANLQQTQTPGMSADNTVISEGTNPGSYPKNFVSPVTPRTRLLATAGDEAARKPIVRPAFPTAVRDFSPIIGMSSNTLLRTCFRVGEAISQSCQAVKTGNKILIELYARVLNSERGDSQQLFTLCDLFHAKPPYIKATYAAAIWKTVQLFEYDSARLLQQGRICRCMGTMKRNGKDWVMTVLNIWEGTWDDVQWVEGIINPQR